MGNGAVSVEPVTAAIQRELRVVVADFRFERRDFCLHDVGRVRHDEIEGPSHAVCDIAFDEIAASSEIEAFGIGACHGERRGADVGGGATRLLQLLEQRQNQRARTRTDIENAQHLHAQAAAHNEIERRFDDGFGFRPRHQHGSADL